MNRMILPEYPANNHTQTSNFQIPELSLYKIGFLDPVNLLRSEQIDPKFAVHKTPERCMASQTKILKYEL